LIIAASRPARDSAAGGQRIDKAGADTGNFAALQGPGITLQEQRAEYGVANTKSAEKAAMQAEKHRARNVMLRSRMRGAIRKVTAAVAAGNGEQARAAYQAAVPVIDSLVNKRVIHRNQANRHKSRLASQLKALKSAK
jgi:small subunit ribosomal protein S20